MSLLHTFSLVDLSSGFSLPLFVFSPVSNSFYFREEEMGFLLGAFNVSQYHSDINQTDVRNVSVPNQQCEELAPECHGKR